jgi:hypothetical protein
VHLIQFFKLFSLGEREDAGRFLDTKIRRGDCIAFEAGDKVNLTKQESNGLFVCLRRVPLTANTAHGDAAEGTLRAVRQPHLEIRQFGEEGHPEQPNLKPIVREHRGRSTI